MSNTLSAQITCLEARNGDLSAALDDANQRVKRAEKTRDRLIERSKELTHAERGRDFWCQDAIEQTIRADMAEQRIKVLVADNAAYLKAIGKGLGNTTNYLHHYGGKTDG